jgi:hypothetical protein
VIGEERRRLLPLPIPRDQNKPAATGAARAGLPALELSSFSGLVNVLASIYACSGL